MEMVASSTDAGSQDISEPRDRVKSYIQKTFNHILSEIEKRPHGYPCIKLHRIDSASTRFDNVKQDPIYEIRSHQVIYAWPGKTKEEAWRFACVGRILSEIYAAIEADIVVTKREIYYRDPGLYRSQAVVDRYIDDIAFTCKVRRKDMNVAASPKGLCIGLSASMNQIDLLMTSDLNDQLLKSCLQHLQWILIVEKEAVFKALAESGIHNDCLGKRGIILTGRGYPDLATCNSVRYLLHHAKRPIPVYGLFDADPDGLEILRCYVFGSKCMTQESHLGMLEITWLGVKFEDIDIDECIPLTARDRKKAQDILSRLDCGIGPRYVTEYRSMLLYMLMLNIKAEIEAANNGIDGLIGWLKQKIFHSTAIS